MFKSQALYNRNICLTVSSLVSRLGESSYMRGNLSTGRFEHVQHLPGGVSGLIGCGSVANTVT
jgi:hypothetical protein